MLTGAQAHSLLLKSNIITERFKESLHFDHEHKTLSLALSFVILIPAGSEASETRSQSVETELVLKVGVFPKGHLVKSRTCNYSATQSRGA